MISKDKAYSLIQKSGNLPTLPSILLKLLAACDNDDTPLSEVATIISKDPVLSFKVLQLVNSAYYGFRYSFNGIEQAVVYLGANTIKNVAVTMSVHQVFERKRFKNIKNFNNSVFWYHSLMCATLAKRIAQKTNFTNIDEAYLSGLLHDIGRLILITTFPEEHETILTKTEDRKNTLWAESQLLGVTHCEAGAWLMEKWQLNPMMADAIRYHHEPLDKVQEAFPLVKIIYLANFLNENIDDSEKKYEISNLLMGLNENDVQDIIEGAEEEVEQIARDLEIKVQPPPPQKPPQPPPAVQSASCPNIDNNANKDDLALQDALTSRIKSASLLSSFLENLVQAGDTEGIIFACEQAMSVLFNIEKVLFFLTENDDILLRGRTSPANSLHQASRGLTLPLQKNASLIVRTCQGRSMAYLREDQPTESLADEQTLTILGCSTVLLVPLITEKMAMGVILLGLSKSLSSMAENDCQLVQVIAQQVGLCLRLERMKKQKAAELEAERVDAISKTARKIAHEINNPLGIISNYIASIKLKLTADDDLQGELTIINEELQRISSMIGGVNMFSKPPGFSFSLTDVNAAIEDIIHIVNSAFFTAPETAVSFLPDTHLPPIRTSKDAIKQILINLLKNASEAMDSDGSISVKTRWSEPDTTYVNGAIEIVVADTGPGLPASVKANLYQPVITTKEGDHSGLGLSIVYNTVKDLGGTISCISSPAEGTSFSIFLPQSAESN
ncbi:MAG: HDOD domain-containing protein [Desulforhopalus sp.]